ncbi:hypothetical protein Slin14017_G070420 [Septoria linicola]|nr:hypothetical protein Slin14017_G070420 [Septoria linicola]
MAFILEGCAKEKLVAHGSTNVAVLLVVADEEYALAVVFLEEPGAERAADLELDWWFVILVDVDDFVDLEFKEEVKYFVEEFWCEVVDSTPKLTL